MSVTIACDGCHRVRSAEDLVEVAIGARSLHLCADTGHACKLILTDYELVLCVRAEIDRALPSPLSSSTAEPRAVVQTRPVPRWARKGRPRP